MPNGRTLTVSAMIDTHAYYQTLKDAGFNDRQADAMTKGVAGIVVGTLATKIDIAEVRTEIANLRADLTGEIAGLRAELKTDIANVRTEIADLRTEFKSDFGSQATEIATIKAQMQLLQRSIGFLATYTTLIVGIATVINHFVR